MIGIVFRCDYPLCPEERQLTPTTGPYADLEIYVAGEQFAAESALLDLPAGWTVAADGRCRCPGHADAPLPDPPTEADTA